MSSPLSDAELVLAARRHDPAAWKLLCERHDRTIRAVCHLHRLTGADADDVRQTTWLHAVEHLERLHQPERIGSWLATVARRECLRALRHVSRVRPCDTPIVERVPDPREGPDARVLASERRWAVRSAVAALPARERALVGVLYADAEPSYAEIAAALRMPIGSIGPTRARVLERLRRRAPVASLVMA